jgi:hypothetical protein
VVQSIVFACPVSLIAAHYSPSNYVSTGMVIFACGRHVASCRRSKAAVSVHPLSLFLALDASLQGNSYREIAEGLFGKERVIGRSWRANDLRSQIIRLVQNGLSMMRGGYRALLHPPSRKK